AEFQQVGFDDLIPALRSGKCNAVISGMTDTAERRRQVDFADYMNLGSSLMVRVGNPAGIAGLASLSGDAVAAQTGTSERDLLSAANAKLRAEGKASIAIQPFAKDAQAAAALADGKADAYFSDDLGVLFHVNRSHYRFEVAASGIGAAPIGIATRKTD